MSSSFDGLENIYSIQANIDALKKAQSNKESALNANKGQVDPDSFLLETQQNFNSMLNTLIGSSDDDKEKSSSDYFSFLDSSQSSSLSSLQSSADLQKLQAMEQNSSLIGRTVTYYGTDSNEEKSGVISKISFNSSSTPILVLQDGTELPAGAVTGLK
jgi:hypothetical protein